MTRSAWLLFSLALIATACSKSPADLKPAGMPAGYDRIDAAFGVRMAGLTSKDSTHVVPTVEFRTNGDYVMYPFSTDCAGNFTRGQGVVFAPDGTVREQLPELANATVAANPQYQPVADKICSQVRAALAAVIESATVRKTRYGIVRVEGGNPRRLTFDGHPVAEDFSFDIVKVAPMGTRDLVLVRDHSGGTACPSQYFLLDVAGPAAVTKGNDFGTCIESEATVDIKDGAMTISMPSAIEGMNGVYTWRDGTLTGNDADIQNAMTTQADAAEFGSEGDQAAGSAEQAYDAAEQAADTAYSAPQPDPRNKFVAACTTHSRRVTTLAGSQVGLDEGESQTYCGCLWQLAPDLAASVLKSGGDPATLDAPRWRSAQGTCIDQLL